MPTPVRRSEHNEPETVLPPRDPATLEPLTAFLGSVQQGAARLVGPGGGTVDLPPEVFEILVDVVETMRQGRAITIAPLSQRLSTTQAAELLGVSRPTLIKLLEEGEIPYEQPRRHRQLRLDDVLVYQERQRRRRRDELDEATRQTVADNLYEIGAEEYRTALREARDGRT